MVVENIRGDAWSLIQVDHGQGTLSVHVRSASPMALQGTPLISVRLPLVKVTLMHCMFFFFFCISDMISSVEEEVDILRDWFGVTFTEIKVPCTHCIRENKVPTLLACPLLRLLVDWLTHSLSPPF